MTVLYSGIEFNALQLRHVHKLIQRVCQEEKKSVSCLHLNSLVLYYIHITLFIICNICNYEINAYILYTCTYYIRYIKTDYTTKVVFSYHHVHKNKPQLSFLTDDVCLFVCYHYFYF